MTDVVFDPIKTGFRWVCDDSCGGMGWYDYDASAEKAARKDRDDYAKQQRAAGKIVKVSTNRSIRTMGGIGTNHPEISLVVPIYRALVIG
jgi:hypothetical protein